MTTKKYLYTERAHYMCPNMHFGIIANIGKEFDEERLIESIEALKAAHPLLASLISEEEGTRKIFYEKQERSKRRFAQGVLLPFNRQL